jgi:hypothetical protein
MNYQDIAVAVNKAFAVGLPLVTPEQRGATLIYPSNTTAAAYDPDATYQAPSMLEQPLVGFITGQSTIESLDGVAVKTDETILTVEWSSMPAWLQQLLSSQQDITDMTQGSSQYRMRLSNGAEMKLYSVTLTGPVVAFTMRKGG